MFRNQQGRQRDSEADESPQLCEQGQNEQDSSGHKKGARGFYTCIYLNCLWKYRPAHKWEDYTEGTEK